MGAKSLANTWEKWHIQPVRGEKTAGGRSYQPGRVKKSTPKTDPSLASGHTSQKKKPGVVGMKAMSAAKKAVLRKVTFKGATAFKLSIRQKV